MTSQFMLQVLVIDASLIISKTSQYMKRKKLGLNIVAEQYFNVLMKCWSTGSKTKHCSILRVTRQEL